MPVVWGRGRWDHPWWDGFSNLTSCSKRIFSQYNMFIQASGIIGSNIYVSSDAPLCKQRPSILRIFCPATDCLSIRSERKPGAYRHHGFEYCHLPRREVVLHSTQQVQASHVGSFVSTGSSYFAITLTLSKPDGNLHVYRNKKITLWKLKNVEAND